MASISEGSGLSVSLENENANKDTGDKSLIDGYVSKIFLDSSDAEYQAGSAQLYDIMGEPGYVLKVSTKEQTYSVGMSMMLHLALALMVISCLTFLAHFSIAKNVMLARLTNFINAITYVQNSGDLSARITIDGNDDITLVADNINNMLESLQNKEGKYRSLFKDSNDAILLFDSHGSIVDANSRASELLGYENSILHGLEIAYLSPDGDVSTVLDAFQQTLNKNSVNSEVQLKLFDGRVIDADVSSSVIDYKKGTVQAIIRDISENKRSAKALLDAKLAAELASRTKSEFIAVMSHELRTPLTSIIGFSDILLEGMAGDLTEKQCSYIQNISTSGNKLLELINDILDLSKIEAEEIELELEIFNVPETFEDIKNIIMPLIAKKCLSLEICIDDNLSVINADRQLFKQVLYNLLSNAIKFTPKEGNITINAELCGDMAKFAVKDNGIGIAKEEHERLFQVFTQLDSSKNRFYEGTGLGLFLVKKFVELHEGKVWLESELGKGSIFYFNIPVNVK
jgi:PAS domain S-box-containing protein